MNHSIKSQTANDFPWSDTHWSNFNRGIGQTRQDECSEGDPCGRVMLGVCLEDGCTGCKLDDECNGNCQNCSSGLPTSSIGKQKQYLNQTGWLSDVFTPQKAEQAREDELYDEIADLYPLHGNCATLTSNLERINADLDEWRYAPEGKRSERRVKDRHLRVLGDRRSDLVQQKTSACIGEQQEFARQQQLFQSMIPEQSGVTPLMFFAGVGVLGLLVIATKK